MKILSIETSCDDTGIAVLEVLGNEKLPDFNVLANIIASQTKIGKKYGGVYPAMAKREHQKNLVPVLIKVLKEAGMCHSGLDPESRNTTSTRTLDSRFRGNDKKVNFLKLSEILDREPELLKKIIPFLKKYQKPDVDLISVTNGPGLEPCLWVGVNFAKALSYFWDIPIVSVNHIESHILVNFLSNTAIQFPAIALVVSGGHTQLILVKNPPAGGGKYKILGETRDDAAGECFDKCAKILGLGYPGGPIIAKLASQAVIARSEATKKSLPRPMINTKDYDFSFSGLKTAVLYADRKIKIKNKKYKQEMAAEIQQAIIDVLLKKTMKAIKDFNVKTIILGGGVSANSELRKQFKEKFENVIFPDPKLSTDNGLMVAVAGFYHKKNTVAWKKIQAHGNLRIDE